MALFVRRDADKNVMLYFGGDPPNVKEMPDACDDWLATKDGIHSRALTYSNPGEAFKFAVAERWTKVAVVPAVKKV